ncbi:MAG: hypothetical protein MUC39_04320, partial [Candidatus Omnitrophica bacterium]|nr:hypothetical protein [Candidatus Omnitrophota bacterium]
KGRTAEAKAILGSLRTAEEAYNLEHQTYIAYSATATNLPVEAPTACDTAHFFSYACSSGSATTFTCTATRCTAGGKSPQGPAAGYNITLDQAGAWGGTAGYY